MTPRRLLAGAWLAAAAVAAAEASGWVTMSGLESLGLCLFRRLTGVPCPGCGMGHAVLYAFQARWADSVAAHPLGLPVLAAWTAAVTEIALRRGAR